MESLGAQLKRARDERKISLREIAVRTKISVTALEALERDDFSKLPGGIFGRSFVRSYAVEVGVDPDETVQRFIEQLERAEREAAERRAAARAEITEDDQRFLERQQLAFAGLRIAVVAIVLAAVVIVVWQIRAYSRRTSETPSTASVATGTTAASAPAADVPTPAAAPPPVAPVTESPALIIELSTSANCWLSVGVDGAAPSTHMFSAGETRQVKADREVLLDVGDAGALHLTINGKPAHALGADGTHVRTRITPQNVSEFVD